MNKSLNVTITFFRGWLVTYSAATLGLAFGILYVWSVIKAGIPDSWGWSNADKALPYATNAIVFSLMMVPAGRLQDRFGPKIMIFMGGFLLGLGCLICGLGGTSLPVYLVGFGLITGTGISLGYSSLIPAAVKWFPREKTGLITGIVVAGVGLAPVLLAPISDALLKYHTTTSALGTAESGVSATMISLAAGIWILTGGVGWFVDNPPLSYNPVSLVKHQPVSQQEFNWDQMLKTAQFWLFFLMFFIGSSAGLVFIGVAAELGKEALKELAFLTVVVLSLGNASGRVLAGIISDKIGRQLTLVFDNLAQAAVISTLYYLTVLGGANWWVMLLIVFLIGMNYGANQTIFPATCKDYFGIRHFGHNYGCLFVAFGLAGLVMPWINGFIQDLTGKPDYTYILIVIMLISASLLALVSLRLGPPELDVSKD